MPVEASPNLFTLSTTVRYPSTSLNQESPRASTGTTRSGKPSSSLQAMVSFRCVTRTPEILKPSETDGIRVREDGVIEYEVSGDKIQAVHMLPGYTHNIINLFETEDLVTVMYCNEVFNSHRPDTYFDPVEKCFLKNRG